ncbi:cell division protein SepF [Patulibacter sp.]|uniref:cell division protein SepF n=1 Tax=Patulibacter sp. TaxID=1912859 RepID=UPI00271A7D58|nr:cell division protein SepF [Patulibacter sp.]MDO9410532.1 cell division protein SepF [Patulibacter sp.]
MALRDTWHNVLVWFALAEERDPYGDAYDDDPEDVDRRERVREPVREPTPVRRIDRARRRREDFDDIFSDEDAAPARSGGAHLRPVGGTSRPQANNGGPGGDVRVHLVLPKSFNDAQQIADRFKDGIPVVINLQTSDTELSKRLIDFASGLTYAMDGGMQRIADKVFMLTPANVSISAEERAQLIEKGFFNQS